MKKNMVVSIVLGVVLVFIISGSVVAYMSTRNVAANNLQQGSTVNQATLGNEVNPGTSQTPSTSSAPSSTNNSSEPAKTIGSADKVKALYLTGWTMGNMTKVQHYVDLAKSTEINSYVIDIKDDDGLVGYKSEIPLVNEIKAWTAKYDVDKVLKAFHDNNIRVIGRVVCFKDPYISSKQPELAVKNINGGLFKSKDKDGTQITWLNPNNKDSWPYLVAIAKEGVKKGFDEIQFDYIRYPNDGDKKAMDFGATTQKRYEVINEFLDYAKKEMPGVVISADVFGIICESPADTENIGQNLEYIGKNIDYISPMAYPSHYAVGQIVNKVKFLKPDLDPYGVVYNTLVKAKDRIAKVEGYQAKNRPYLQDFTASWLGKGYYQSYGADQVRQQIKAANDAGVDSWILWNSNNRYSEAALLPEK